jgi:hypothetical protein
VEFGTWRGEPITWQVLAIEDGRALIISDNILTTRQYDDLGVSSADQIDYETVDYDAAATAWAESDIRAWLNDEFLRAAFTQDEQDVINHSNDAYLDDDYDTWSQVVDTMEPILDHAYDIYESGERKASKNRVDDAYFDYYEALGFEKTVMAHISGDRAAAVEYQFSFVKRAMEEGQSADVRASLDTLISLLREDATTLDSNKDIKDKIFLLSVNDAIRYFAGDDDRIAYLSMTEEDVQYILSVDKFYWGFSQGDLANVENRLRSDWLGQSKAYQWYLRTPGSAGGVYATFINSSGSVRNSGDLVAGNAGIFSLDGSTGTDGSIVDCFDGIRPALWLNL